VMENVILPIYDIARDTSRFKYVQILNRSQWLSPRDLERLQNRQLRVIIKYAYETVPYYNRMFRKIGITSGDVRCVEDLSKLPVLTKEDVRANSADLVSRGFPAKRLVSYTSGGSGDQLRFFVTKDQLSWEIAAEFRAYGWAGYKLGDKCFMFWASPIDLSKYKTVQRRFTSKLERVFVVDTYIISNQVLAKFASLLRARRPKIVKGYTSSIYLMAKYLVDNGMDCIRPKAVITTAETLFGSMRATIEEAFGCQVFDYYGSREVGGLAAECPEHSGYHISAENVAMEFVKDGKRVSAGEKGMILLTSLRNFGMPLIRYQIGDVGIASDDVCSCGRGLPLIHQIQGRVSDFVAIYDYQLKQNVPVGPIYIILNNAMIHVPLRSVRLFQESLDKFVVKAVKDKNFSDEDTDKLIEYMRSYLGSNVEITVEFADFLPPAPSGKRPACISRINPFE
jgi:phenylacetate-CoA ligase